MEKDIIIIRELAKKVNNIALNQKQDSRRKLWSQHNSLNKVGVPIYIRDGEGFREVIEPLLTCETFFYREYEYYLRRLIYQDSLDDDFIIEPWIKIRATHILPNDAVWGINIPKHKVSKGGTFKPDSPIKNLEDIDKLSFPKHIINEEATKILKDKLDEAIGDILPIVVDRNTAYSVWNGDLSTDIGYLRGIETIMWDIMDNPKWLHKLLAFMRDGVLNAQKQAEKLGDLRAINSENQSMPYSKELISPSISEKPIKMNDIWGFVAAQETSLLSPSQFDEFMFNYQLPIMEQYGLTSYGCCEDLSKRISIIKRCKNLRRIAITPWADVRSCAEQIGRDYVCSYRPNPSSMICAQFDESFIMEKLIEDLTIFKENNCIVDICLKDIQTVQNDSYRLKRFVEIAREAVAKVYS